MDSGFNCLDYNMTPLAKLVYEALRFSYIAMEEGLAFERDGDRSDPESFFMNYSYATDDINWETLAQRVADRVGELEETEWMYKDLQR